jgi:hypothetical protein
LNNKVTRMIRSVHLGRFNHEATNTATTNFNQPLISVHQYPANMSRQLISSEKFPAKPHNCESRVRLPDSP